MSGQLRSAGRQDGGACQADHGCRRAVCFQVQLEAAGPHPTRRQADVCADHLGGMVQQLSGWAREGGLTGGRLTIFAVDPAAARQPAGFAFAEIEIPISC
jgi:hypothetical protein